MNAERRPLAIELEDDKTRVMTCAFENGHIAVSSNRQNVILRTSSEKVQFRMRSQYPETIVFPSKSLYGRSLAHVPNSNRLVFSIRDDEFMFRVEEGARDIVEVTSASIDFPCLCIAHSP